jgi:hypothetical protein
VESGDDSGGVLVVPISLIAEKHIAYYWRHAAPYVPQAGVAGVILRQNTDRQAAIVTAIGEARRLHATLAELERDRPEFRRLIVRVKGYFWEQPLWRLQRIGDEVLDFLYANREIGTRVETIELRPGVAFCLRRSHGMLTQMIQGGWLAHVRKLNGPVLGTTADLEEFLFGSARGDLSGIRPVLIELQERRCFYCHRGLARTGDVDHFVPWAQYPVDLGHNFVLAHASCNGAKGSMLAAEEHLGRWVERNRAYAPLIAEACDRAGMVHDLPASLQIASWAYEQAAAAGGALWREPGALVPITDRWRSVLR